MQRIWNLVLKHGISVRKLISIAKDENLLESYFMQLWDLIVWRDILWDAYAIRSGTLLPNISTPIT